MKSADEIIAAMREVCDAASENGFTFCASLSFDDKSSNVFCGNPITVIGLSGIVSDQAIIELNEFNNKESWPT